MKKRAILLASCCVALGLALGDAAAFEIKPGESTDTFKAYLGTPEPSKFDKSAALTGTSYTVIDAIQLGINNNYSFIRFVNGSGHTSVFFVTIVGNPSGKNYGTVTVTVPNYGSPQYGAKDITNVQGFTTLPAGESDLSFYVRNTDHGNGVGFQHVVWNSFTGFFENASICTYYANVNYSVLNQVAVNLDTAAVTAYPSVLVLHNPDAVSRIYQAYVYSSISGGYIGSVYATIPANATFERTVASIQQQVGYTTAESHLNVIFASADSLPYTAISGHFINNLQLDAYTNMSMGCGINN